MLTTQNALQALALHANNKTISANAIVNALNNASVTFASVQYVTPVATSAKHKNVVIQKVVQANVQLFCTLKNFDVYTKAVQRSANKIATNDSTNVEQFVAQSNYFEHDANCFSLVAHKQNAKQYLYAIYNSAQSVYFVDGRVADKQQVAQYLTASAAAKLLGNNNTTTNVTNNVTHDVKVRTIALENLVSIVVNKQQLTV
jgi:hypothetical protein